MTDASVSRSDAPTASAVVAANVRRLRSLQGLTAGQLGIRCAQAGASRITENVINNMETGRRTVSVDDLLALAHVLQTSPTALLMPTPLPPNPGRAKQSPAISVGGEQGEVELRITSDRTIHGVDRIRQWLAALPPAGTAPVEAAAASGKTEAFSAAASMAEQFDRQAELFVSTVRQQVDTLLSGLEGSITEQTSPDQVRQALTQARSRMAPAEPRNTSGETR